MTKSSILISSVLSERASGLGYEIVRRSAFVLSYLHALGTRPRRQLALNFVLKKTTPKG